MTICSRISIASKSLAVPAARCGGANAVNGVINIITKNAADTRGLHAEAGAGKQLQHLAGLRYGGSFAADVHFRAYAKSSEHERSRFGDGARANDAWRTQRFALRSSMDLSERLELDIAWRRVDSRINNSGLTPGSVPSYADLDLRLAWRARDQLELSLAGQNLLHDHYPSTVFRARPASMPHATFTAS